MKIAAVLVAVVLLVAGYFLLVFNWSYSEGERAGWIQKFSSGSNTILLFFLSSACALVGTSSTAMSSPVSRPATRAPDSVTIR